LVVGDQTVFLSHFGLFHSPHNFQVILEATFARSGGDPGADYFNDRKHTGTKIYTLEPEPFVLPRLAAAEPLRSFKTSIYRGNYEAMSQRAKDAARIGQDVDVTVTKVIHFRKFEPAGAKSSQMEYILFGKGGELFLAHLITRPPDFDQILSVKAPDQKFTDEDLSKGPVLALPGKANSVSNRIQGTGAVTGQIKRSGAATPSTVKLQPGTEFRLEQDDFKA
jgi:hypothetical protein